ncbi:MAG: cobalt-precorrin-6A reductase, partial [Rhodospirillaceae bacterium]|nr:cobalt-precorrin-6A reductase [Rhodospirillaceae bacterium]
MKKRLLILGGTTESADLATRAIRDFGDRLTVITSLAGRTQKPGDLPGEVRCGGFGGAEKLAVYLKESPIDWVIDATHPFAATISTNARIACDAAGIERLQLARPPWKQQPGDRWVELPDMEAVAEALAFVGRRAFITTGAASLAPLSAFSSPHSPKMWFLIRLIERPAAPLPLGEEGRDYTLITGKGPFSFVEEAALLAQYKINVMVSKM